MNRHWTVRLGDVAQINPKTPKGIGANSDVAFVPMAAVSEDGRLGEHVTRPYSEVSKGYSYFERGDVLLAKITPCFENGKAALVDNLAEQIGFGSTEFHVLRAGPDLDAKYLFYMLWNERFRADASRAMTGSAGQKRVPADLLHRTELRLPPLDEQRRIAAILDKADALRQKRKRAIALLDSLTQSTFLEMFGPPHINPKAWSVRKLGAFCATRLGKMLDQKKMAGLQNFPYLANYNVQWGRFVMDDLREMGFSGAEQIEFELRAGDLLVCEGGDIGRAAIWTNNDRRILFQKALHRVRPDASIATSSYLQWYLWFMSKNDALAAHSSVSTIAHLTGEKLRDLPVPLPPIDLQFIFDAQVSKVQSERAVLARYALESEALFASLQHRAFSGQL